MKPLKKFLELFIDGEPAATPRARTVSKNGKTWSYTPHSADAWKQILALNLKRHMPKEPFEGAIVLEMRFYMPVSKNMLKWHEKMLCIKDTMDTDIPHLKKPDADNLLKTVMDVLKKIGLYKDDCQVYRPVPEKIIAREEYGTKPGVFLTIYTS